MFGQAHSDYIVESSVPRYEARQFEGKGALSLLESECRAVYTNPLASYQS